MERSAKRPALDLAIAHLIEGGLTATEILTKVKAAVAREGARKFGDFSKAAIGLGVSRKVLWEWRRNDA